MSSETELKHFSGQDICGTSLPSDLDNFAFQHSISPEIGIHGLPVDNFSYSESGGVNLSRFSIGIDLDESASSNWTNKTSVMLEVCACCYVYQKVMSIY